MGQESHLGGNAGEDRGVEVVRGGGDKTGAEWETQGVLNLQPGHSVSSRGSPSDLRTHGVSAGRSPKDRPARCWGEGM